MYVYFSNVCLVPSETEEDIRLPGTGVTDTTQGTMVLFFAPTESGVESFNGEVAGFRVQPVPGLTDYFRADGKPPS